MGPPLSTLRAFKDALEVQVFYEGPATPHSCLLEDVREVLLDGVLGDVEGARDLAIGCAAHDELYYVPLPVRQAVGGCLEPGDIAGAGGFYNDHRHAALTVDRLRQPA